MISWGVISSALMFTTSAASFYVLRFLLGVAEAGFFPGIILYLTYWYPAQRRARMVALFMSGVAVAGVVGGPLSGWIMKAFAGLNGWSGWQWLFLLEGLPSVLLVWTLFYLDDGIRAARWLSEDDKQALERELAGERSQQQHLPLGRLFAAPRCGCWRWCTSCA
jgi:MFS family permease